MGGIGKWQVEKCPQYRQGKDQAVLACKTEGSQVGGRQQLKVGLDRKFQGPHVL